MESDVSKYVSYVPEPLAEVAEPTALLETVSGDLKSLGMDPHNPGSASGLKTKWLVENPSDFGFLSAGSIKDYNGISALCQHISVTDPSRAHLNACLVSYYPSGKTRTRLHNDDLPYLNARSPIWK